MPYFSAEMNFSSFCERKKKHQIILFLALLCSFFISLCAAWKKRCQRVKWYSRKIDTNTKCVSLAAFFISFVFSVACIHETNQAKLWQFGRVNKTIQKSHVIAEAGEMQISRDDVLFTNVNTGNTLAKGPNCIRMHFGSSGKIVTYSWHRLYIDSFK